MCKKTLSGRGRPNMTGLCSACQMRKYAREKRK